ncbi:MAG: TonB-dependent receptor [Lacunisphaera sp.]
MFPTHRILSFAAFAALAASSLRAQSAPPESEPIKLDDIVVTATRTERPINATPGTVNVVDLRDLVAVSLNETIRGEPLVSVPFSFSGSGVAYQRSGADSVNIRGVEGNRVLLQVDGVRVPDEFSLGGSEPTGRDYFDPELFKRLEILQGSASALYGSDALGGVVTFTTKSPEDYLNGQPFYVGAKAAYRSVDDGTLFSGTAAAQVGKFQALVIYARRDGHELENNGSVPPNPEDYSSNAVLAKLAWLPSAPHRFELSLENFDRDSDSEVNNKEVTSGTGTTTGLALHSSTQRFRLGASYTFTGDAMLFDHLEARVYSQDANTTDLALERIAYNPASAANGTFRNRDITTSFNNDTTGFLVAAVKKIGATQRFAYGVEGSRTDTDKPWSSVVINSKGTTYPDEPRMAATETGRLGAYVQDEIEWKLGAHLLTLIPGVRVDQFKLTPDNSPEYLVVTAGQAAPSFDETAVSPKLGVLFGLTGQVNLYASYNRGFRYPTAEDLTATFTNPTVRYRTIPNPDLQEENERRLRGRPEGRGAERTHRASRDFRNALQELHRADRAGTGCAAGLRQLAVRHVPDAESRQRAHSRRRTLGPPCLGRSLDLARRLQLHRFRRQGDRRVRSRRPRLRA